MKKDKMMIVMRTDLGMGAGKMIAQAGHAIASLLLLADDNEEQDNIIAAWACTGMKKVCVGADSEAVLLQCVAKSKELGIPVYLVCDSGLTQVDPGTNTCCAIGPGKDKLLEKVTGSLKLLP